MSGVITCLVPLEVQLTPGASYLLKEDVFVQNSQETYKRDKRSTFRDVQSPLSCDGAVI